MNAANVICCPGADFAGICAFAGGPLGSAVPDATRFDVVDALAR
jgi:hypothetical protein